MADRNLRSGSDFQLSRDNTAPSSSPAEDNAAQDQHALEHEAGSVSPLTSNFNSTFESRRQGTTSQRYSWESGSSAASEGVDQIFDNEDNEDDSDCECEDRVDCLCGNHNPPLFTRRPRRAHISAQGGRIMPIARILAMLSSIQSPNRRVASSTTRNSITRNPNTPAAGQNPTSSTTSALSASISAGQSSPAMSSHGGSQSSAVQGASSLRMLRRRPRDPQTRRVVRRRLN